MRTTAGSSCSAQACRYLIGMKTPSFLLPGLLLCLFSASSSRAAQPLQPALDAVSLAYGKSTTDGARLLKSSQVEGEPLLWHLFADDPHRSGELVKIGVSREAGGKLWTAQALGSGQLLQRVPPARIELARVKVGPLEARRTAAQGAALARVAFDKVEFQLAMQPASGAPEWALTLFDAQGQEIGFVVLSAETGAVVHQDFTPPPPPGTDAKPNKDSIDSGEEAARAVKRGARRAWEWTEKAGRETKGFFRELFR